MKVLFLVAALLGLGVFAGSAELPEDVIYRARAERIQANVNNYFDDLVHNIRGWAANNGLDPLSLPDHIEAFSFQGIIIEWHGELDMTNGYLKDISTLDRRGDIIANYENKLLTITANIGFEDLKFFFNYLANFMDITYDGTIDGTVTDLTIYVEIVADMETLSVHLQGFEINHTGSLNVEVHGNGLGDLLANAIVGVVTGAFKDVVMGVVEVEVRKVLEEALAQIHFRNYL
ncbi:hypothetical protein C0J52_04612 [Blattella germanica]|nr:hypothetical protein C0J52_04612 [Blattella germanica]